MNYSFCFHNRIYHFLIIIQLNAPVIVLAQANIHGSVNDTYRKPMVYANVLLLNTKDSTLVKGTLTNQSGDYLFENIKTGTYLLSASGSGVAPAYSEPFKVSSSLKNIEIPAIQLKESTKSLENITVAARKPLYEQKIDRLVINVSESITAAGNTALDILERSPGILVNRMNNSLSINGKGGVIVMINGKRNYMDLSAVLQMLAGMPADNIERIEIITTPPANFDAQGDAGFINIILKANNNYGTNGSYSVSAGYEKGEMNLASINFNHRKEKLNVFGNESFSRMRIQQYWTNYHAVNNAGSFMENYDFTNRHALPWQNDFQVGIDYSLNKKHLLGALLTHSYRHWTMEADNSAFQYKDLALDTSVSIINKELHTTGSYGFNLNYQYTRSETEKVIINFDYLNYMDKNPNNYSNNYFDLHNRFINEELVKSDKATPLHFWIETVDYQKKISAKIDFEAGIKSTLSHLTNEVDVATLYQNSWKSDSTLSGFHNIHEDIEAAYSTASITISKKTSAKLGLRYEHARSAIQNKEKLLMVDRNYSDLFPSLFFLHSINDSNSISFSYSKRIWRPSFANLAPWVIFYDPKTFQTGNPDLLPSLSDAINLNYRHKAIMLSLNYTYMKNPIENMPMLEVNTNRLINTFSNGVDRKIFYLNISMPSTLTKWWKMQNNGSLGWSQSTNYYKDKIISEASSYSLQSAHTFTLPKDYTIELTGYYNSKSKWGLESYDDAYNMNMGISKKLEKIKARIVLNINNLLKPSFSSSINHPEQNLIVRNTYTYGYKSAMLTFNKRFGNDKLKEKRERTTGAEDERNRAY